MISGLDCPAKGPAAALFPLPADSGDRALCSLPKSRIGLFPPTPTKVMRTITLSGILLLGVSALAHAQTPATDPVAITILDRMADNIGALHACSFHLEGVQDAFDDKAGTIVKRHNNHEVSIVGPDKMLVISTGDGGHRSYWYDGKVVVYYSFDENNFARIAAPPTVIGAIDSLHAAYGIDFPAADFIYPSFVDDLIAQSERVVYLGTVKIGSKECFHIAAKGAEQDVEFWIASDAATFPVKYVVRSKDKAQPMEFEGTFTNWQINPDLPSTMFGFTPPPGARQVGILARDSKRSGGQP